MGADPCRRVSGGGSPPLRQTVGGGVSRCRQRARRGVSPESPEVFRSPLLPSRQPVRIRSGGVADGSCRAGISVTGPDRFRKLPGIPLIMSSAGFIPRVQRLPSNQRGRDFVVGDLHGCYSMLLDAMKKVSFDPDRDRLLSVGDLCDRGPDSWSCLRLLEKPWFFAVKGNHEDLLLDFVSPIKSGEYSKNDFLNNGGDWLFEKDERNTPSFVYFLREHLKTLPHILIVGEGSRRFHVIHTELVSVGGNTPVVFRDEDIDVWETGRATERGIFDSECLFLFDRNLFAGYKAVSRVSPGLSPTFCGHSVVPAPVVRLSHINLDTGAFRQSWGRKGTLTLVPVSVYLKEGE